MLARSYFGVGFLRGLNSVVEVFAPYAGGYEYSPPLRPRSNWNRPDQGLEAVLGAAFANVSEDVSEQQLASGGTSVVSAYWSDPLPTSGELEKIERIIPGGAERLLCMAEKKLDNDLSVAEKKLDNDYSMADKKLEKDEQDMKRGQYLGWSLAMGAVITATVVSLCHASWQVSVTLVGIPVLGAVQTLIQGRKEKAEGQSAGSDRSSRSD